MENRLKSYRELEVMITQLEEALTKQNKVVKKAYESLQKEKGDVEVITSANISNFVSKMTRTYEDKKKKEETDLEIAERDFLDAKASQLELIREIDELKQKKEQIIPTKEEYFELFKAKMTSLLDSAEVIWFKNSIEALQRSIQNYSYRREQLRAALSIISTMEGKLNVASAGSVIDLIGIPMIGEGMKYYEINQLTDHLTELNHILIQLDYPTLDLLKSKADETAFGAVDVIADNFVLDAVALGRVLKLKGSINDLEERIHKEVRTIQKEEKKAIALLKKKSEELEAYIINA